VVVRKKIGARELLAAPGVSLYMMQAILSLPLPMLVTLALAVVATLFSGGILLTASRV
jgi:hypothetical protein